jgi:FtsP/CotA-like multicopper oxidase with cupredoxin domain
LNDCKLYLADKSTEKETFVADQKNTDFHASYETLVEGIMGVVGVSRKPAVSDNNLINGKMNYDCSLVEDGTPCVGNAGISKFRFTPGKSHLLRIINGGSAGLQYFSVDEHDLEVISMDFVPIKPYKTNYITLGVCTTPRPVSGKERQSTRQTDSLNVKNRSANDPR